ncbi:MAG: alpha/beta fold hydrolase [Rhodoferax sp.]
MSTRHIHCVADDGQVLPAVETGQGPPLVLLHGWTSSHAAWAPLVADLAQHHRVIRPDARGHGGHPWPAQPLPDLPRLARDLQCWIDDVGAERVSVVGHSMGALTLWQYVRDFGTARLDRLCVLDQSPKLMTDADWALGIYGDFDAQRAAAFSARLRQDLPEAVLALAAHGLNTRAFESYARNGSGWQRLRQMLRAWPAEPLAALWDDLVARDWRDVLPRIDRPTLLIYGTQSNFYRAEVGDYVARHTPQATLLRYEGADHSPHLMHPQRFVQDWHAFYRAPSTGTADHGTPFDGLKAGG